MRKFVVMSDFNLQYQCLWLKLFVFFGDFLNLYVKISYGPRKLEGFGLTDGEVMERLWSYLRPTGKITKEMTATHRIDALTDFLLHYTRRSRCQIGAGYNFYSLVNLRKFNFWKVKQTNKQTEYCNSIIVFYYCIHYKHFILCHVFIGTVLYRRFTVSTYGENVASAKVFKWGMETFHF